MPVKLPVFLLLLFYSTYTDGQELVSESGRIVYTGYENRLRIKGKEKIPGVLSVSTDNGKIFLKDGIWYLLPEHTGTAILTAYTHTDKDRVVSRDTFTTLPLPNPVGMFAGKIKGSLTVAEATAQESISARILGIPGTPRCTVTSFILNVKREGILGGAKASDASGVKFSMDQLIVNMLTNLRPKDTILFEDIKCNCFGKQYNARPFEIAITSSDSILGKTILVEDPLTGNKTRVTLKCPNMILCDSPGTKEPTH